jgi:hypothetical protein
MIYNLPFSLDLLTVSETSNEPPQEEGINSPRNLALEATFINHNLSQQVLKMVFIIGFIKWRKSLILSFHNLVGRRKIQIG